MIAEAEVGSDGRKRRITIGEDDGAIVWEPVAVVIDDLALFVHGNESAAPVEDVVMRQEAVYSLTRTVGILAALSGTADAKLL
jgi:hypothetical protein